MQILRFCCVKMTFLWCFPVLLFFSSNCITQSVLDPTEDLIAELQKNSGDHQLNKAAINPSTSIVAQECIAGSVCNVASSPTPRLFHALTQIGNSITARMDRNQIIREKAFEALRKKNYTDADIQKAALEVLDCPENRKIDCDMNYPYQTYDGSCNNLESPSWGQSNTAFLSLLSRNYDDDDSAFRRSKSGSELPAPRRLSINCHGHINKPDHTHTHLVMLFGQFLDHDFTLAPPSTNVDGTPIDCCNKDPFNPQCANITIFEDDPFFSKYQGPCLHTARTQRYETCSPGPRQQPNTRTAYIDASQTYGNNENAAFDLREFQYGFLKSYNNKEAGELLPRRNETLTCNKDSIDVGCFFLTGDSRHNQHTPLICLHTAFLRFHNLIAERLGYLNSHWTDEQLYQETRCILIYIYQKIVYKEFLLAILGRKIMDKWNLLATVTEYNPNVHAGIYHEFATAAYRLHTTIDSAFVIKCRDGCKKSYELRDIFFQPFDVYGGICNCTFNGFLSSSPQKVDRHVVKDVTNHLFQSRGKSFGLDIVSLNLMRGRDHGLQPYTKLVKHCLGIDIENFDDLLRHRLMKKEAVACLRAQYEYVDDIDLYTGGFSEIHVNGGIVGPTLACIIARQFHTLKYGDRFFYTHKSHPRLTEEQKRALRDITLKKVFCITGFIDYAQKDVMFTASENNPVTDCDYHINLDPWYEEESKPHHEPYEDEECEDDYYY